MPRRDLLVLGIDQHEAHAGDVIFDPVTATAHRDMSPQQITSVVDIERGAARGLAALMNARRERYVGRDRHD